MSSIRDIDQDAKRINEMFPDTDYLVIIELLKKYQSINDVIEQINGNRNGESKENQKISVQNQTAESESNIQTNNSSITTSKTKNQTQTNKANIVIQKNDQQANNLDFGINFLNNNNFNSTNNENKQSQDNQISQNSLSFQAPLSFDSTPQSNNQALQLSETDKQNQQQPILTLPKYLQNIKPNMLRFGSFAGPINPVNQNSNLTLNYSSSSSTSSLSLYTSPPSSYNSAASTKISLSSEENKFESFQPIITKDVTTQLDINDEQDSTSIDGMNDLNRENNGEVKYLNLQNPGYSRYQNPYSDIPQPLNHIQIMQFQQQQMLQQQQQHIMMQMRTPDFQPQGQQPQTQQIFSPQYMPPDPKFMVTQQQMVSQFNLAMPQQVSQENVVGNK